MEQAGKEDGGEKIISGLPAWKSHTEVRGWRLSFRNFTTIIKLLRRDKLSSDSVDFLT